MSDKNADTDVDKPAAGASSIAVKDANAKKDPKNTSMHVRIASPFKIFYDDDAQSLSGKNASGPFDILPHHHNFISLLSECELVITTIGGSTKVRISGGFMHVKADQVVVFLNV